MAKQTPANVSQAALPYTATGRAKPELSLAVPRRPAREWAWLASAALLAGCSGYGVGADQGGAGSFGPLTSVSPRAEPTLAEETANGGTASDAAPAGQVGAHDPASDSVSPPSPTVSVAIVEQPTWAIQYRTSDSRSDWLELGQNEGLPRVLPSRSPTFARAHIAWLRKTADSAGVRSMVGDPRATTVLWSTPERLYHRGLHSWFKTDESSRPQLLGGVMRIKATLRNDGLEAIDVASLALTASRWAGLNGTTPRVSWQLEPAGAEARPCGDKTSEDSATANDQTLLQPGATSTRTFCTSSLPPDVVMALLRDSAGITVAPVSTDSALPASRTLQVHVDYGGYRDTELHQVILEESTTAGRVFNDLGLSFTEGHNWWSADENEVAEITGFGLTQVQGIAADADGSAYFMVTLSRPSEPTLSFNPHVESYHFDSIELQAGDVFRVGLIVDRDRDGLPAELETQLGSSDTEKDSDADGLDDGLEVLGWRPDDGNSETDSSQVVDSDPTVADTDGDGVNDWAEYQSRTDPRF